MATAASAAQDLEPSALPGQPISVKTLLAKAKRPFWFVGLFSLCSNLLMLALPLYSLQVLDRVMSSHSLETLLMLSLLTTALFIFLTLFTLVRSLVLNRIAGWLETTLSPLLLGNAVSRSAVGTAVSASQLQRDLGIVKSFINSGLATLYDAPWSIVFLLVIYAINPILGFITLLGCVLLLLLALLTELITKRPIKAAGSVGIASLNIAEAASRNAEAIEAMGMLPAVSRHWERYNKKNLQWLEVATNRQNVLQSISKFVRLTLQVFITGIGGYMALQNELSIGGMIAGSMLAGRALSPFEASIGVWKNWIFARDAHERLEKALGSSVHWRGTMALPAPKGDIAVENLIYRAPGNDRPILKGIGFRINAGESLGIIGPSAAGKSTLAKLLIGVLAPSHGSVRLDGAEVFKWNRANLGPYVGYMPQHVELFAGTVKDNIARMDPDASAEDVLKAAQMAGVHELILRLPKGYETMFSPNDVSLSPGQRQRIGLARALYGDPKFIVLDEPNGNLDGDGERALVECLARLKQTGATYIVVAHRPSIVSTVDKILTLKDGLVEQFGPRQQVLQKYIAPPGDAAAPNRSLS